MSKKNLIPRKTVILPIITRYLHNDYKQESVKYLKGRDISTLIALTIHPDKPLSYYAKSIGLEFGSFTYLSNKLQKQGYVDKIVSKDDKRKIKLIVTDKGKEIANQVMNEFDAYTLSKIDCLEETELEEFYHALEILEKLQKKMEERNRS